MGTCTGNGCRLFSVLCLWIPLSDTYQCSRLFFAALNSRFFHRLQAYGDRSLHCRYHPLESMGRGGRYARTVFRAGRLDRPVDWEYRCTTFWVEYLILCILSICPIIHSYCDVHEGDAKRKRVFFPSDDENF